MENTKTPGVHIVEKDTFSKPVVEVATAIPAFIGITETALNGEDELKGKPWKISSMIEYQRYFGQEPEDKFVLSVRKKEEAASLANCLFAYEADYKDAVEVAAGDADASATYVFTASHKGPKRFTLYYQLLMFFANGGRTCYVVSAGTYAENQLLDKEMVSNAFKALEEEREITLVVIPEAVYSPSCHDLEVMALDHCGKMQNRLAILDVQSKETENQTLEQQIEVFQTKIGDDNLSYGAAYHPWLETSLLGDRDINANMFEWDAKSEKKFKVFFAKDSDILIYINNTISEVMDGTERQRAEFHKALLQNWVAYQLMVKKVNSYLNLLPPSASMAGLYTMVDDVRGPWKAPANVLVNNVSKLEVNISSDEIGKLNMPLNGKAINAIRFLTGDGIKIWGARTLDSNSPDRRYISVRRTLFLLEKSVKNAVRAYVFEPNTQNTWLSMKCMMENILCGIWKKGGLAGAAPEDAYSVHVGLGTTMTPEDIQAGIVRITVLVAISRPAEFLEITFQQQQMQKS